MNILAVSGSLRAKSSNTAIVRAFAKPAPPGVHVAIWEGLGDLPHFNPELDTDFPPEPVKTFRARLKAADGIFICTPEYAFGIPGALKNALDWIVSSGELLEKPVAAVSASPSYLGGDKALASLLLTLEALGARVVEGGALTLPFIGKKLNADGELGDAATLESLRRILGAFVSDASRKKIPES